MSKLYFSMCVELSPHGDAICDLDGYVHCFADVGEESGSHSDNLPGARGREGTRL